MELGETWSSFSKARVLQITLPQPQASLQRRCFAGVRSQEPPSSLGPESAPEQAYEPGLRDGYLKLATSRPLSLGFRGFWGLVINRT